MSTPGRYCSYHLTACGGIPRAGHEAASNAGFSEVAVARCSAGISSAAAAPMPTVIAPIVSAGTNPCDECTWRRVAAASREHCGENGDSEHAADLADRVGRA